MIGHRNREFATLRRRARVAKLYCEGYTAAEVAEQIECSPTTVHSDLKEIRALWLSLLHKDFDEVKAEQLAKIDHLESEAWKAWDESKKPAETEQTKVERAIKVTVKKDANGKPYKSEGTKLVPLSEHYTKTSQGRSGDPRFLQIVDNCIDRRLKILGLMDENKVTQVILSFDNLLREQRDKLQQAMDDPIEQRIVLEHQQVEERPEQERTDTQSQNGESQ